MSVNQDDIPIDIDRDSQVEVEVIRNAYASGDTKQMTSTFHGTEASVSRTLNAHIDKLRHAPHELEKEIEKVEHTVREGVEEIEQKAKHILPPQSSRDDDEDEGWTSDRSDNQRTTASTSTSADRRKSLKLKTSSKAVAAPPRKGRRRNSMQKGMFGRAHLLKQKHLEDAAIFEDSDEEKDGRGRSQITTGEAELGRRGSAINSRIDVIKRIDARREESPTRSIRFADETGDEEHKSETPTPQISILQDPSVLPPQTSLDDADSPTNKVTFEIGDI
jgi:sodium/hydrogen antiporter